MAEPTIPEAGPGMAHIDNGTIIVFAGPPVVQDMPPAAPLRPTDDQIRDFLRRNPDALRQFLRHEALRARRRP